MKMKNYTTMTLSESFCSLKTTASILLLGVLLLTNTTVNAQNNALHFDGIDDYVSLPASINGQITNNVTIEGWFNIESIGDQVELVGEWYDNADPDIKFAIYYDQGSNSIRAITSGSGDYPYIESSPLPPNTWVHIAATYDGLNLRLYYNGVIQAVGPASSLPPSTGLWVLGKRTDGPEQFKGKMDEIRIWNTARTVSEILANYKNQVPDNSTGLIAYYKMNQGVAGGDNTSVTSLIDASTSNLNGTFNGFTLDGSTSNFVSKSTVWNSGWSEGEPNAITDAIIDGIYSTTTNGAVSSNSLTVNSAKSLTINSLTNVTVQNEVINNGTLVVENNANLIQVNNVTNTGAITVNRNSNALHRLDFSLWSSPVTGAQTLAAFSPLTSQSPNRFYTFSPTANEYVQTTFGSPFTQGTGYLIRMPNSDPTPNYNSGTAPLIFPGVFTGIPNNGTISVTTLATLYNASGNPYPSVIDAELFKASNTDINTLYFWRKTNNPNQGISPTTSYAVYNIAGATGTGVAPDGAATGEPTITPDKNIQVGQGFLFQTAQTSVVFNNGMRIANNGNKFLKTKQLEKSRIWLNLSNALWPINQIALCYMDGASVSLDETDSKYINDSPIALTSNINDEEYSIQGRPTFDATDVVALNFKTNAAGDYTIAIDHVDGLFSGSQDVYLVDSKTGTETNLKTSSYPFTAAAGVDNARFSLKYQKTLKVDAPAFDDNSISVYNNNGTLYVNSKSVAISNIKVFDVQGRLLAEQKNVKSTTATINNLRANHQVLIVKITSEDNKEVTKKLLN